MHSIFLQIEKNFVHSGESTFALFSILYNTAPPCSYIDAYARTERKHEKTVKRCKTALFCVVRAFLLSVGYFIDLQKVTQNNAVFESVFILDTVNTIKLSFFNIIAVFARFTIFFIVYRYSTLQFLHTLQYFIIFFAKPLDKFYSIVIQ